MSSRKLLIALSGMLAMGLAAFWGMGALWSYRIAHSVGPTAQVAAAVSDPVHALQQGMLHDLEAAERALRSGHQSEVARALDGARRVARVGNSAASELFSRPLGAIDHARRALQDGHSDEAIAAVRDASASVAATSPTGRGPTAAPRVPTSVERYRNAVVLDGGGDRIGRVKSIDRISATLVLGGKQGVFGFINLGGRELTVPLDALVFGDARALGPTMVVLTTAQPE